LFGSYCRSRNMTVELGIAPDHPHPIIHCNDGLYTIGGHYEEVKKLNGTIEEHGHYRLYKPLAKEKITAPFLILVPFDEGIIYEILENMETLRRITYDAQASFLPETKKQGQ